MLIRLSAAAVSFICTLTLAACGSSDTGGGDASAKGDIKIMVTGPISAPVVSLPTMSVGTQVAVDEINKAGGIDGRKLELITCNDKSDPNTALTCARQAVKDKVAAVVGGFEIFNAQVGPILDRANIPWIGPAVASGYQMKNQFFIGNDTGAGFGGMAIYLAEQGCPSVAAVQGAVSNDQLIGLIEAGAEAGGATFAGNFKAPANGADWAPTASAIASSGAKCVVTTVTPDEMAPLLVALKTVDPTIKIGTTTGTLPTPVLAGLKGAADGVLAFTGYYPLSSDKGDVQKILAAASAANPEVDPDSFVLSGYAAVKVFEQVAKGLDEVSSATILKALPKIKDFDTHVGPIVDFTTPNPVAEYARLFSGKSFIVVVKGDEFVLAQDEPVDSQPALEKASK